MARQGAALRTLAESDLRDIDDRAHRWHEREIGDNPTRLDVLRGYWMLRALRDRGVTPHDLRERARDAIEAALRAHWPEAWRKPTDAWLRHMAERVLEEHQSRTAPGR